jgi:hypothetical protein
LTSAKMRGISTTVALSSGVSPSSIPAIIPTREDACYVSVSLHYGFSQPMDTVREKNMLDELWHAGKAPWKTWT